MEPNAHAAFAEVDLEPYRLKVRMPFLPPTNEADHVHWSARGKQGRELRRSFALIVPDRLRPATPLLEAAVTFTRFGERRRSKCRLSFLMSATILAVGPKSVTLWLTCSWTGRFYRYSSSSAASVSRSNRTRGEWTLALLCSLTPIPAVAVRWW